MNLHSLLREGQFATWPVQQNKSKFDRSSHGAFVELVNGHTAVNFDDGAAKL